MHPGEAGEALEFDLHDASAVHHQCLGGAGLLSMTVATSFPPPLRNLSTKSIVSDYLAFSI